MQYIRATRTLSVLAIMCFLVLALAPAALAQAPDGITTDRPVASGEEVGALNSTAGQLKAEELKAQADTYALWAEDFAAVVQTWTLCVQETAAANEGSEDEAVSPLSTCSLLDVNQSPGLKLSGESVSIEWPGSAI